MLCKEKTCVMNVIKKAAVQDIKLTILDSE